ncbi:hypothetical protein GCM10009760_38710 [Kitasatospora kazusensis]|uniref:ABC transporter permease n=1 Tax=Kitasatospora kazusensis TaxID=407974 RepID=A0ABP5LI28_9ACTN
MRVLLYEVRRLSGLRSTWFVLAAVLLADAAVAAVLARQLPAGPLSAAAALRSVTAVVPLLPLPIAALGAGALGALSYGHEVRHPGLAASRVACRRRLGLLAGKLVVTGLLAALLALGTVLLDAVVLRVSLAPGVRPGRLLALSVGGDPQALADGARPLAVFAVLVVLAGWTGLLTTSLVRSAAAGLLILCALPALLEPVLSLVLRLTGRGWPVQVRESLPFQYGLDAVRGADLPSAATLLDPVLLTAVLASFGLLLLAAVLAQARRRTL